MKVLLPDAERTARERATVFDFTLPPELEAGAPAEERGLTRDGVRMLISYRASDTILHTSFCALDTILRAGDVLVINTSGTLPAALPATRANGQALEVHLSTQLPGGFWTVELREPDGIGSRPFRADVAGETLALPAGGTLALLAPYPATLALSAPPRLWLATLRLPRPLLEYLDAHGEPIRYSYARDRWPISAYQTVYANTPGSAEMPSAGRAFTPEVMARLVAGGVQIVPLLLHCGVASLEEHDPPFEEWYRVPSATADAINAARARGGRVVAVGTTVVRALETVTDAQGAAHPGAGWTSLVLSPARPLRAVDALLTGWHEPRASHLALLGALATPAHLKLAYDAALCHGYLWHEFGDLHLLMP
jgi:S-adenosylmethionine:tRNA ribosyltransferase-isomerase